jgi:hypothetical protein
MKAKKIASKVGRTALNAAKLGFQLETGDLRGINNTILDAAKTWGGKNNILQRTEDRLDKRLSKNRFYRVGKAATNLYYDSKQGNYTGAYDDSMQVARQVLGKKRSGAIRAIDERVQKYVMPTAQTVQDAYKYQKAIRSLPSGIQKARNDPSLRNVAMLGFKVEGIASKTNKIAKKVL